MRTDPRTGHPGGADIRPAFWNAITRYRRGGNGWTSRSPGKCAAHRAVAHVRGMRLLGLVFTMVLLHPAFARAEYVTNGDFSAGGVGWIPWTATGQAARLFNSADVPAGGAPPCFKMIATGPCTGGIFQPLDLVAGRRYTVSVLSRDLAPPTGAYASVLIGVNPPQNGQDYFDDGASQSPPGTLHLLGWNQADCPGWNGNQSTVCAGPLRFTFVAPVRTMYLVLKCGPGAFEITFDKVSVQDADECGAPQIAEHPKNQSVCIGDTAVFSVAATGTGPLIYQWRYNGRPLVNDGHYAGVNTPTLTVANVTGNVIGFYTCIVTNACGSALAGAAQLRAPITYVDAFAAGNKTGASWTDAFTSLEDAIAAVRDNSACDRGEIWVANGVYQPRQPTTNDPRSATFRLADGVQIYGGFEGASQPVLYPGGETQRDQRRPANPANATLLTNDPAVSRFVVTSINNAPTALLDGFVINAAEGQAPGCVAEFFFQNSFATIRNNTIITSGSHYLDLAPDPDGQPINLSDNRFIVHDQPLANGGQGTLLELRSPDYDDDCVENCPPGAYQLTDSPGFDDPWAFEQLEIRPGQRLALTDRRGFLYQSTREVAYVRHLILREGSVLNTASQRLYYQEITIEPDARIINVPLRGFSLQALHLNDTGEFDCLTRPDPNNTADAIRIVPDARGPGDGVMRMTRIDPALPVGIKARFDRAGEDFIGIAFEYRFRGSPSELIVSLSDTGEPGVNNIPVARIRPPPPGRPGAPGQSEFAVFRGRFPRYALNLRRATFVQLDLVEPQTGDGSLTAKMPGPAGGGVAGLSDPQPADGEPGSVDIDNWGAQIVCSYGCADLSGDGVPDDRDYLLVLSLYGQDTSDIDMTTGACPDSVFGGDQYVDVLDLLTWDLILDPLGTLPNACNLLGTSLLAGPESMAQSHATGEGFARLSSPFGPAASSGGGDSLLIAGKSDYNAFQEDALYTLDMAGVCSGAEALPPAGGSSSRSNGRLVRDRAGQLYQLHGMSYLGQSQEMQGLIRLSDGLSVVPPRTGLAGPPGSTSTVSVGLNMVGFDVVGVPLVDAAFHPSQDDVIYVIPVLVTPSDGSCPYRAAARLQLQTGSEPPYLVTALYGLNPAPTSNVLVDDCESLVVTEPDTRQLRELEVDASENLYITSAQASGANDYILVYDGSAALTGEQAPILTFSLDGILEAPVGLALSALEDKLYLGSAVDNLGGGLTRVYRFQIIRSAGAVTALAADGAIDIHNPTGGDLGYGVIATISSIHETPDGTLAVAGLTVPKLPPDLSTDDPLYIAVFGPVPWPLNPIFSTPTLALIPPGHSGPVNATAIICYDLVLPLSIITEDVTAPTLDSALSRKTHGLAGDFDIDLPLSGTPGSEPRDGGPTRLVFTFSEAIRADDGSPGANEVILSAGTLSAVSIAGNILTADLAGVPDESCLTMTLAGLSDLAGNALSPGTSIQLRVIQGDSDGDGAVTAGDVAEVKGRSLRTLDATCFRSDVNADGYIDCADIVRVKTRTGRSASCP